MFGLLTKKFEGVGQCYKVNKLIKTDHNEKPMTLTLNIVPIIRWINRHVSPIIPTLEEPQLACDLRGDGIRKEVSYKCEGEQ